MHSPSKPVIHLAYIRGGQTMKEASTSRCYNELVF